MAGDDLRARIAAQYGERPGRADVWRALDWFLDTRAYLNLGYTPRGWPTLLGSSQRRLVDVVGRRVVEGLPDPPAGRLLDVGCGRGGPAARLADRHGFAVVGVDLVRDNVVLARANAVGSAASFVVGDATALPVDAGSMGAATAIDALVYVPDVAAVLDELARALEPGAPLVVTDLVLRSEPSAADRRAAATFAEAWDMPPLRTADELVGALSAAGFELRTVEDLTPNSVGRFRRYTAPFLWLVDGRLGRPVRAALARAGLDPTLVTGQVRSAHRALPALRHVLVVGEQRQAPGGRGSR